MSSILLGLRELCNAPNEAISFVKEIFGLDHKIRNNCELNLDYKATMILEELFIALFEKFKH